MRKSILFLLRAIFGLIGHLPMKFRINLVRELIQGCLWHGIDKDKLRFLFEVDNHLYSLQGKYARDSGGGVHTKHEHLKYYKFFAENLRPGLSVLDVGSGVGYMDYQLVQLLPGIKVTGIELGEKNWEYAQQHYIHPNLRFIQGDIFKYLPDGRFDAVTLSNVLEHFKDRVGLLNHLRENIRPELFIIRVPAFERDWRIPLKAELGIDYRLDSTHYIEYKLEEFRDEMNKSGLIIKHMEMRWGEIWSVLEPAVT